MKKIERVMGNCQPLFLLMEVVKLVELRVLKVLKKFHKREMHLKSDKNSE